MGGRLLLDELVDSLRRESWPVDASGGNRIGSAHRAVVVAVIGAEVPGYSGSLCMGAHGTLIPAGQRLLRGGGLKHIVVVVAISGLGVRPTLPVSLLELPKEGSAPPLAIADDAEANNRKNEGESAKGDADTSSKRDRTVVWCWNRRICW